ncbi:ribosomal-protein-alanine N-acetyltransferase [Sphingomonas ginkgonis]|uniref:Ribosomal-protein-alanine N-acetyltransferase n=1 Tax=Sphingomonas ginkgonis TaxID=2315330 RepID=A0A429VCR4_9SPHN|nr:ribosomal protein S18-alanine N-acetyltransferase [Sphingomonas ginkgonis]RST31686.1 ribosomal-protein-alanine N-acetyltransferase [Sphingomonas ginkgonis]
MNGPQPAPALALSPAGAADLDEVMLVMRSAFAPEFGEAWTRGQCAGILPMSGVSLVVARSGDEAVGFSLSRTVGDEAELLLIGVRQEARREGVASSLLEHFIARAKNEQVHRLHLEVRDGNAAIQLYRKFDFTIVGRRASYYRGGDGQFYDALTLALLI